MFGFLALIGIVFIIYNLSKEADIKQYPLGVDYDAVWRDRDKFKIPEKEIQRRTYAGYYTKKVRVEKEDVYPSILTNKRVDIDLYNETDKPVKHISLGIVFFDCDCHYIKGSLRIEEIDLNIPSKSRRQFNAYWALPGKEYAKAYVKSVTFEDGEVWNSQCFYDWVRAYDIPLR